MTLNMDQADRESPLYAPMTHEEIEAQQEADSRELFTKRADELASLLLGLIWKQAECDGFDRAEFEDDVRDRMGGEDAAKAALKLIGGGK